MMEWVKLGDVCEIISGTTPSTNNPEYWNGDIKWITPAEIDDNTKYVTDTARKITQRGFHSSSLKLLPKNTVLLSSRAPIGKVAIAATEMCCNQGFKNFVCEDVLYHEYLYYYLKSKTDYLNSLGRGATFKEISKAIVEQIKIPLLPIKNQIRIAETLDKVQGIIDARKKQIEKFDEYIKSVFYTMFGDPVTNPMGWEIVKLEDLMEKVEKIDPTKFDFEFDYIDIASVSNKEKEIISFNRLESENAPSRARQIVFANDILVSTVRPNLNAVAVLKSDSERRIIASTGFCVIRLDGSKAHTRYVFEICKSPYFINTLVKLAKGVSYPAVTDGDIKSMKISLPPLTLQTQFASIVEEAEAQKELLNKSLSKMETLFDCLMGQYFS